MNNHAYCYLCNMYTPCASLDYPRCWRCGRPCTRRPTSPEPIWRDPTVYGNSAVGSEPVPASVVIDAAVVERACEAFYADESFKWGDFSSPGKKIAMERMTAALKAIR